VLALGGALLDSLAAGLGDLTALVLFHTCFNIVGTALYLPFTGPFAALVARLIPDTDASLTSGLDRALLKDEGAAMDAAQACCYIALRVPA